MFLALFLNLQDILHFTSWPYPSYNKRDHEMHPYLNLSLKFLLDSQKTLSKFCKKTRTGACKQHATKRISKTNNIVANVAECETQCKQNSECAEFNFWYSDGDCGLFLQGCEEIPRTEVNWYTCYKGGVNF